jgi:hypothetical protein
VGMGWRQDMHIGIAASHRGNIGFWVWRRKTAEVSRGVAVVVRMGWRSNVRSLTSHRNR